MNIFIRILILIAIIIFGAFYFTTTTSLSTAGQLISRLKQELNTVEKENIELTLELSRTNSLNSIEHLAQKQKLTTEPHFIYLAEKPSSLAVSIRNKN